MTSSVTQILGAILLSVVLAVAGALAWHGTLTGAEIYGLLTTVVAAGIAAVASHQGAQLGARAAGAPLDQPPPPASAARRARARRRP